MHLLKHASWKSGVQGNPAWMAVAKYRTGVGSPRDTTPVLGGFSSHRPHSQPFGADLEHEEHSEDADGEERGVVESAAPHRRAQGRKAADR